jgi:hypothetical protein
MLLEGLLAPLAAAFPALDLGHHALAALAEPEPQRLDSDTVPAVGRRVFARSDALAELIVAGALPPEDLWATRGIAQLFSTIARVGATGPWRELSRPGIAPRLGRTSGRPQPLRLVTASPTPRPISIAPPVPLR